MQLRSLYLENFRIFASKQLNFSPAVNLILGPNGVGKTSILEAIMLFVTGKSFRASKTEQMICFNAEFSRLKAVLGTADTDLAGLDELTLQVMLTPGIIQGKKTAKKLYRVNDVKRSRKKMLGNVFAVAFRPEDMRLVEGSPSRRRSFLDTILSQVDQDYARSLNTYEQALRRKNKLLFKIREGEASKSVLKFWDMTLLKHGQILQEQRQNFLEFCLTVDFPLDFNAKYQASVISERRIKKYEHRSIAAGYSLIGPQKDDFIVDFADINNKDVAIFGSRGQQRLAVLWLKTCALHFLEVQTKKKPLLLLDDIFSELDQDNKQLILPLTKKYQTIITTTEEKTEQFIAEANKIYF